MNWEDSYAWIAFGLVGNAAFATRFLSQWIASERAGRSIIPVAFWYVSIVGSLILLVYAIHRREPIFVLAYLFLAGSPAPTAPFPACGSDPTADGLGCSTFATCP